MGKISSIFLLISLCSKVEARAECMCACACVSVQSDNSHRVSEQASKRALAALVKAANAEGCSNSTTILLSLFFRSRGSFFYHYYYFFFFFFLFLLSFFSLSFLQCSRCSLSLPKKFDIKSNFTNRKFARNSKRKTWDNVLGK